LGLFDKLADVAEDVGTGIFSKALKPAGKGAYRGLREYDERVLDPLAAILIQEGTKVNEQTFTFDIERLLRGQQPFERGNRTYFGKEVTPRDIDYLDIAFGKGASRRREQAKARATLDEVGLAGEILAKTAVDPFNVFVIKQGTVVPAYKGARAAVRGVKGLLPGGKAAVTDLTASLDDALRQAPTNPEAPLSGAGASLNEGIPDLGEMAATIMSEQARESAVLASRPFRPFRFLTNRFFGSANTAKAESLDAVVPLEAAKFEQFGTGADLAAVLTDDQFRALGLVAQFDDELVTLNSGVKVTMRNLMEKTGGLKLTPAERAAVENAKAVRKSVHDWGETALENHFLDQGMKPAEAAKAAAEIIRETPLEVGQSYWPRMAASIGEEEVALARSNFFNVGRKAPNLQLPRTAELPGGQVRHSGDVGGVLSRYAQQVFYKVQQETVIKPLLKRLAIDPKTLTPTAFKAAVEGLHGRRDWLRRADALLGKSKGLSGKEIQARVAKLVSADVPEEWKAIIRRLETGEIIGTPTPRDLARRGRVAAGEAARAFEPSKPKARLAKAAEAAIASEEGRAGASALREQSSLMRQELKAVSAGNAAELTEAQRQLKVAERLARVGYARLPESRFPGITEVFERTQAEAIEAAFSRLDPRSVPRFLAATNNWVGIGVGVQAGSFDIGFIALQMFPAFAQNPLAFPAMFMRATRNKAYLGAIQRLQREAFRDGKPMLQQMIAHDLRLVSEPLMPDVMAIQPGTITGKVSRAVTNWPLNRMFTRGINLARMQSAKYGVRIWEALRGRALTPDEYRQIMRVANTITGDFNWTRAGVGQVQRSLERIGLRFAPSWLRANLQWIAAAAHPSMRVEANVARLALANTIGVMVGLYSISALMMGQTPKLDVTKTGEFMTVRVKGMRVGPGGVMVQVARTIGKAAKLVETAATAETPEERAEARRQLLDIREGRNPIRQFWRAGAPLIGGLVYDIVANEGVQSYTQRPLTLTPEGLVGMAESTLPFAAQSATSGEGVTGFFGTFLGGRAFPVSPPELFLETADAAAQQNGFRTWEETPKATRAEIMRKSPELRAAEETRDKFFERFPQKQDREDFVFGEVEKSRKATEESLLAIWQGVQAGNRDIVEFRQAFSDLMAKHGALSNQLMDGFDDSLKRRNNETLQDFYARMFHTVQPESFDGKAFPGDFPDGVISPEEWELWREGRTSFWAQFPEAQQFRSYIETEYPTRNWASQEMADLHQTKIRMNQTYQALLEIPKYRGLSAEAGNFIDSAISLADRKVREIKFALAEKGIDPNKVRIPAKVAWRMVLEDMRSAQLTPEQMKWLKIAVFLDLKPRTRRKLLSSERARFLMENRELTEWYPSAFGDAGLRDREIALLGLAPTPLGASVQERVASLTG